MPPADSEIAQLAQILASHAVLLVSAAILLLALALAAVIGIARVAARHWDALTGVTRAAWRAALRLPLAGHLISRTRAVVPAGYLMAHLLLGVVITAASIAFGVIAVEVMAGRELAVFDVAFANALHAQTTPAWRSFFVVITTLGRVDVLAVATAVVAALLFTTGRVLLGITWTMGQACGGLLNLALKNAFERVRPEFADPVLAGTSWSFPSGHAMGTFVFCGLAAYVLLYSARSWTGRGAFVTLALAWCILMGFSRLYLGVHYASDVLAGFLAGTVWVAACVSGAEVALRWRRRRPVLTDQRTIAH